jgi:hypothetical protein
MRWLLAGLLLPGCVATPNGIGGEQIPAANAAVATAIAGGVAAERRREGDCYTPCTPGNVCNPKTGYCEPVPCGGTCRVDEVCDQQALIPHCVAASQLQVNQPAAGPGKPIQAPPPASPL